MSFRVPNPNDPPPPPPPPPPAPDHSAALAELEFWRAAFPYQTPRAVQNIIDGQREKIAELKALLFKMENDAMAKAKKSKTKKAKK